ncbi:MAG: MotA/TolQ/ExbB proton channel family protein [Acidobacteriota bacterium]|nr:MotA/TolQ/ExbB proton channel family protein [Acidobacteriota bacterium]
MKSFVKQKGSARAIFLLAVALSAIALFALSFVRGEGMINLLARVITQFVVPLNALIMFGFAVIVSLVVGIFAHYYLFELKHELVYDGRLATHLAKLLNATDRPLEQRIASARDLLRKDRTLFGQILQRFLAEKGFENDRPGKVWQSVQDEEFERVKRNLMYFSLASVLAPAMGFLGTSVGMVAAFYEISIQDTVTPADLAVAIQIALITTVCGLVIKTFSMLLKTMVVHSVGRREDQIGVAYQQLFDF